MNERLIMELRNGIIECEHDGALCAVDENGALKHAIGDMEAPRFLRSAGKPLQIIPAVKHGVLEQYNLSEQDLALMMSSHRGEHVHMETLEHIMLQSGLSESALQCAASYPLHEPSKEQWIRSGGQPARRFHNCSGKHFGILSWCKLAGYDLESYLESEHPAQQEMTSAIIEMSEVKPEHMGSGTDGCGFPVYALPMPAIAKAYLKLACPDLIADPSTRAAVERIGGAMTSNPLLVGGTGRLDSVMMEDPNILAKGGFKGIFGFALREERLGFAVKIADGADEECAYVILSILKQLGYKRTETIQRLETAFPSQILNDQGLLVGESRTVFQL
ncbi:asparaginase [Paenibacillus marinisediminis]